MAFVEEWQETHFTACMSGLLNLKADTIENWLFNHFIGVLFCFQQKLQVDHFWAEHRLV